MSSTRSVARAGAIRPPAAPTCKRSPTPTPRRPDRRCASAERSPTTSRRATRRCSPRCARRSQVPRCSPCRRPPSIRRSGCGRPAGRLLAAPCGRRGRGRRALPSSPTVAVRLAGGRPDRHVGGAMLRDPLGSTCSSSTRTSTAAWRAGSVATTTGRRRSTSTSATAPRCPAWSSAAQPLARSRRLDRHQLSPTDGCRAPMAELVVRQALDPSLPRSAILELPAGVAPDPEVASALTSYLSETRLRADPLCQASPAANGGDGRARTRARVGAPAGRRRSRPHRARPGRQRGRLPPPGRRRCSPTARS